MSDIHEWASSASGDFVVVHTGPRPDAERVHELIDTLTASDRDVDSDTDADSAPDTGADICVADDGSNPLLSRSWQTLCRRSLRTVTVRTHHDPLDRFGASDSYGPPTFVVRRTSLTAAIAPAPRVAWRRPSWWIAAIIVLLYALVELVRTVDSPAPATESEQAWMVAAEAGSATAYPTGWPGGSSAWPALMRPLAELGGLDAVRLASVVFSIVAICCAASAASRLFGRWAARSTAVAMSLALALSSTAATATPTMLATALLAVAFLAIAFAEVAGRTSWLLLSGIVVAIAVAVEYQTIVIAIALAPFLIITSGRAGRSATLVFATTLFIGIGWWFVPLRFAVDGYTDAARADLASVATGLGGGVSAATLAMSVTTVIGFAVLSRRVESVVVRRRLVAAALAGASLPFTRFVVGAGIDVGDATLVLPFLAPALCGLVAHQAAAFATGREVVPRRRIAPDVLTSDPSSGRLDGNHVRYANRQMILAGGLLVAMSAWFVPWAIAHTAWNNWWLAVPFVLCNLFVACTALLLAFNNAKRSIPLPIQVARGHEPLVGVIIPTMSEPVDMVTATVQSVVEQDWPIDRLRIVVSDDGYDDDLRQRIGELAAHLPAGVLEYFRPPERGSRERIGESKAGNLNAAIRLLNDAGCEFVETRDADDLVGDSSFLRATVSHMMLDPRIGFVQTIKESKTSDGDPFNNNELLFYRGMMLSRNADHCAFPCGSGLVWRRAALREIGNFPVWNLVEDIHSGVLALRLGWRGLYVPIVGAYAQHAPEDVANYFKQRGTWAIDSIRLFAFDRFRKMPWRMRLHFVEQTAFYLLSLPIMALLTIPMLGLAFGQFPIDASPTDYAIHFTGFALSMELIMLAFAADKPLGAFVRTRVFLIGMAPLYATSALRALWYGASRKPIYVVTRKTDEHRVYVGMLKVHWFLMALIVGALVLSARRDDFLLDFDPGSIYWAIVGLTGLGAFVRLSWFGVDLSAAVRERLRLPAKAGAHLQSEE